MNSNQFWSDSKRKNNFKVYLFVHDFFFYPLAFFLQTF